MAPRPAIPQGHPLSKPLVPTPLLYHWTVSIRYKTKQGRGIHDRTRTTTSLRRKPESIRKMPSPCCAAVRSRALGRIEQRAGRSCLAVLSSNCLHIASRAKRRPPARRESPERAQPSLVGARGNPSRSSSRQGNPVDVRSRGGAHPDSASGRPNGSRNPGRRGFQFHGHRLDAPRKSPLTVYNQAARMCVKLITNDPISSPSKSAFLLQEVSFPSATSSRLRPDCRCLRWR